MREDAGRWSHGGLGAALVACTLALTLLTPSCRTVMSEDVETKAERFLADTKMSERDREATARDLARLCQEGLISGC
jgi:hypothetical protein